ncbi:MAG: hypothetical protein CVV24_05105 [Ignavibacteriae bacterium HGW-Ignavibacteriae-3]|nr:MAG: hypothetical protein CVV24_05105 [Ignavibacteriae bacterium HGW-Ignavibacteriae-3]
MKKLFTITIAVFLIAATGCQDQNSLVQPDQQQTPEISFYSNSNSAQAANATSGNLIVRHFIRNIKVDGKVGGNVKFKFFVEDGRQLEGILKIDAGAFPGTKVFDAIFDLETLTIELTPHGNFKIPAHLDLRYMGYDLKTYFPSLNNSPKKDPVFYYFDDSGDLEEMPYANVNYNFGTNVIFFKDMRLPHFSRFGFIR